jgi:predicted acyl esterase
MSRFWPAPTALLVLLALATTTPRAHAEPTTSVDFVMGDGVTLRTDIYTSGTEPQPVILIRTPYHRSSVEPVALEIMAAYDATIFVQDVRGRGDSQGVDSVFRDDALDGRESLDWIEFLGWSNGVVASWGSSALAITQMLMAPDATPLYQCQYTSVGTHAIADQVAYRGGVRRRDVDVWLTDQDATSIIGQWDAHPDPKDAYWETLDLTDEKVASIRTAGIHVGGWFDVFQQGTIDYFSRVQTSGGEGALGRQHLLVGPWSHGGQDGDVVFPLADKVDSPLPSLESAWREGCLHAGGPVLDEMPAVYLYIMGDTDDPEAPGNVWEAFTEWPPPSENAALYLREDGLLSVEPAFSAQPAATYTHDPSDPVPTLGGTQLTLPAGPVDQAPIEAREDVAVFTTAPLEEPVEVIGRLGVRVWLSSVAPLSQVAVRLTDVYPDGRSILVAEGIARFDGSGSYKPVDVDLWSTAMIFNTGHQIRLSVSGASADAFEVAPAGFTAQIGRSSSYPSRIELPLRSGLPGAQPPIAGSTEPAPQPEPEPQAETQVETPPDVYTPPDVPASDGGAGDLDPGPDETLGPPSADTFESDSGEPAASGGGGGGGGCAGAPSGGPWFLVLGSLLLALRRGLRPA